MQITIAVAISGYCNGCYRGCCIGRVLRAIYGFRLVPKLCSAYVDLHVAEAEESLANLLDDGHLHSHDLGAGPPQSHSVSYGPVADTGTMM